MINDALMSRRFVRLYGDGPNVNFASHMSVCAPLAVCATMLTWHFMTPLYAPGYMGRLWRRRAAISRLWQKQKDDEEVTSRGEDITEGERHLMDALRNQHDKLPSFRYTKLTPRAVNLAFIS